MNEPNINVEALSNIEVWECVVKDHDEEHPLILKRELVTNDQPYVVADQITISHHVSEGPAPAGKVTFPTNAAYILASALNLMQSD
jgi:hypothetical protein